MAAFSFVIAGAVNVSVNVTEVEGGDLRFDLAVLDGALTGDLRGLFFDLANDALASGLTVSGVDATGSLFRANAVTNLGQGVNINGEILNEYGKFDAGIVIGTNGLALDDMQQASFVLSHNTANLTLADVALQDFAVRLTSVGVEGGSRDGSLKLGGTSPDGTADPVHVAADDTLTVENTDDFADSFDFLDSGAGSVLANDTTDGSPYLGDVLAVGGDTADVAQVVAGSDGGLMIVYADGTLNFSANGEFDWLGQYDVATTTFTYGIEGGASAVVTVTVTAPPEIIG